MTLTTRFDKSGRQIVPLSQREQKRPGKQDDKVRYVLTEAYCPEGCSLVDHDHPINGYPGLKIAFKRSDQEGEFVISAIEGDFEKIILSGTLEEGVKDDLFCPYCQTMLAKLINCNCLPNADMVVVGMTPKLDFNNGVTFCNVTGCGNGAFVKSGDILRHIRLMSF